MESCRRSVSSVRTLFLWFGHVHARHSSFSPGSASDVGMRSNAPSQILVDKRTNATCDTSHPTHSIPLHPLSPNPSHPQSISQILSHPQCLSPSISLSIPVILNPHTISLLDRSPASPLAVGFSHNACSLGRFHRDLPRRYRWGCFWGRWFERCAIRHITTTTNQTKTHVEGSSRRCSCCICERKRERGRWKGSTCTWHAAACTDSRWTTT